MIFTRFIAIALILTLMEPVGDYASRFILPKEERERKLNPDDIVYDEKTRTESIRNPFVPPQCPRKSSSQRYLLTMADAAAPKDEQFAEESGDAVRKAAMSETRKDNVLEAYAELVYSQTLSVIANEGIFSRPIIVIGDPHGAYDQLLSILQHTDMVSRDRAQWIGKNTIVVIMGDLIHRGRDSAWLVYKVFYEWQPIAPMYGSNVIVLFGNHELQQFWYDFRTIAQPQYGYKQGSAFHVPDDGFQRPFLQNEVNLLKIKKNSLMIVKIGKNLFTHSGFEWNIMRRFCDHQASRLPAPTQGLGGDELIVAVNDITREKLIYYSNQKLKEIISEPRTRQQRFNAYKDHETDGVLDNDPDKTFQCHILKAVLMEEIEKKGDSEIQRVVNDLELIDLIFELVSSVALKSLDLEKSDFQKTFLEFRSETLARFAAETLWVGHFYGQMVGKLKWAKSFNVGIGSSRNNMIFTDLGMLSKETPTTFFEVDTGGTIHVYQHEHQEDKTAADAWPEQDLPFLTVI